MAILDFLKSGKPPKEERGRGGAGTITGRQMPPEKSVKEKKAEARKKGQIKKMSTSKSRRYSDNVTKSNTKVGDTFGAKAQTFGAAFKAARKKQGAGGVFTYKGKKYTTDYATETKKVKAKKKITAKKKNIKKAMGITDNMPQAGGSSIMMGLNKGGMAQGYGRAAMRPGKDPRTISKT